MKKSFINTIFGKGGSGGLTVYTSSRGYTVRGGTKARRNAAKRALRRG